jgi:hypothetical protein
LNILHYDEQHYWSVAYPRIVHRFTVDGTTQELNELAEWCHENGLDLWARQQVHWRTDTAVQVRAPTAGKAAQFLANWANREAPAALTWGQTDPVAVWAAGGSA